MIVCLSGSVRFLEDFDAASVAETLAGRIVLSVGSHLRSDAELFSGRTEDERQAALTRLAKLHRHKIKLADELLVINVGGYVGESTHAEIEYARAQGKRIRWLEPGKAERGGP